MNNKTVSRRKVSKRTIFLATILALTANLIAPGASPAAASTIGGVGELLLDVGYSPYLPDGVLLSPGTDVDWVAGGYPIGTLTVGTSTFTGEFSLGLWGSSDYQSYLGGGVGNIDNGFIYANSSSGSVSMYNISGTYTLWSPQLAMTLTGNMSVCSPGCSYGPVTIFIEAEHSYNTTIAPGSQCASYNPCTIAGGYIQTDDGSSYPEVPPDDPPDDLPDPGIVREITGAVGTPSSHCDMVNGGLRVSDNTTQGVHSKLYVRLADAPDQVDVCVRVEQVPSGSGYGGKLAITPTGLDPEPGALVAYYLDTNSAACAGTTDPPNQVPGNHPITAGGLGGVPYMVDAYMNTSEAWVCLSVNGVNNRVKVPFGNPVPGGSLGYVATWYPDPGTP